MSSQNEEYRYEIKIPLQMDQFVEFESSLKGLCLYPKKVYQDRTIHSIYLDTPLFKSYNDNVSGAGNRVKIRFRYYDNDIKNVRLEYKIKNNKASTKKVIDIKNEDGLDLTVADNIKEIVHQNSKISKDICCHYPVLEVGYKRSYFEISKDIRMTIDRDIKYRKLYPQKNSFFVSSPVYSVIEFKYPLSKQSELKKLLYNLPFRIFRHSKYVIGVDTVCAA